MRTVAPNPPSPLRVTAEACGAVSKLSEKEQLIAQQYRAAARQAIQGMQVDVLRCTQRHDDLKPDIFLSRVRRILPSEYLAAWSAWTGIFTLINADNNVMFAMWALYSILALGYVYLRLLKDRQMKDIVDTAVITRSLPPVPAVGRGGAGTTKTITVKADGLSMVPSGVEAVSMSRFSEKQEIAGDAMEGSASIDGDSDSDGGSTGGQGTTRGSRLFSQRLFPQRRGGRGRAGAHKAPPPLKRSPSNLQLFLQALVSAAAFMLLSAFAADIHTTIGAPVWVFFAPVAPFALFAQFVLPDGLVSRR